MRINLTRFRLVSDYLFCCCLFIYYLYEVEPRSPHHGPELYCAMHYSNTEWKDSSCPKEFISCFQTLSDLLSFQNWAGSLGKNLEFRPQSDLWVLSTSDNRSLIWMPYLRHPCLKILPRLCACVWESEKSSISCCHLGWRHFKNRLCQGISAMSVPELTVSKNKS